MAATHVQTRDAQSPNAASIGVTLTGVAAGNHLFASTEAFRSGALGLTSVTSSPAATWANIVANTTQTGGGLGSGEQGLRGDYSQNVVSGSWTVTTHGNSNLAVTIHVTESAGVATTASNGASNAGSSGSSAVASQAAGSITPQAGSILIAFWVSSSGNSAAPSADNSFILRSDATGYDGVNGERAAQFTKDNVAATPVNVTVSESSGTAQMITAVAEFLAAGAAPASTLPQLTERPDRWNPARAWMALR